MFFSTFQGAESLDSSHKTHLQKRIIWKTFLIAAFSKTRTYRQAASDKKKHKRSTATYTYNMGGKFQKGDKILYGQDWEKKGKVDFVLDLGNEQYQYAITLDEELQAVTT